MNRARADLAKNIRNAMASDRKAFAAPVTFSTGLLDLVLAEKPDKKKVLVF